MGSSTQASAAWNALGERERRWQGHVQAISSGDAQALAALYDDSVAHLFGVAVRLLANPADAEEVTLDVFEQVWRNAQSFDPARGSVWRWLSMLARSRAIDRLRSKHAEQRHVAGEVAHFAEIQSGEAPADEVHLFRQQQVQIQRAMSALPAEQRRAVELAYFSELTHTEIAGLLGVPLGTVKARIRKGVKRLRLAMLTDETGAAARTIV